MCCVCVSVCMGVQDVSKESVSYRLSVLRGLVTEGSSLMLMRLIVLRGKVPEHMTFISFDQRLNIIHSTFVSSYVHMTTFSFLQECLKPCFVLFYLRVDGGGYKAAGGPG